MNKVILIGRLVADPEVINTQTGTAVARYKLAVDRHRNKEGQQEADFITCQAWRQTAEFICRYFKKGSSICIAGSIQTRSWTDSNGQKRYATEVVADEAYFVDGKNDTPQAEPASTATYIPDAYTPQQNTKFEQISTDSDLPF